MKPGNDDPPYRMFYESVLEERDEPAYHRGHTIKTSEGDIDVKEGDKFFDTRERVMLTVEDVAIKVREGNRGAELGRGPTYILFKTDDPADPRPPATAEVKMEVMQFVHLVKEDYFVPHKKNDYIPPELQR